MGRKSQSKHSGKEKVDKDRIRRVKQLFGLSERILRLTTEYAGSDAFARHESMSELLNQVLAQERSAEASHNKKKRTECLATFKDWLRNNGAQFEGVEISEFEGYGLGLKAMRDFPAGSHLLSVPRSLMMTDEEADKSCLAPYIRDDPLLSTMPNVTLALFLLFEKQNPDSFWKPYLDTLPERYTTVLYFSTEELKELKPSPVLDQALKLCRSIARQYAYIYTKIHTETSATPAHPLTPVFTYDAYRWAVSTVMTRQNSVAGRVGFIPLWDMCNHEHGTITTDYNVECDRSECFALRDFRSGDQIMIFYGVRSNADLFLHNGFVYPQNEQDSMSVHLGVSNNDPQCALRLALLAKLGLGTHTQYLLHSAAPEQTDRTPFSPEVLAFARIISMKPDELSSWSSRDFSVLVSDEHADIALDKRAYSFLRTRCELIVTTYARHNTLQQQEQLSPHRRNVRLLKESEVRILTHTIAHCQRALDTLQAVQ